MGKRFLRFAARRFPRSRLCPYICNYRAKKHFTLFFTIIKNPCLFTAPSILLLHPAHCKFNFINSTRCKHLLQERKSKYMQSCICVVLHSSTAWHLIVFLMLFLKEKDDMQNRLSSSFFRETDVLIYSSHPSRGRKNGRTACHFPVFLRWRSA